MSDKIVGGGNIGGCPYAGTVDTKYVVNQCEKMMCSVCGIIDYYDESQGLYYNYNGNNITNISGAWCHWCDSGYLCGRTTDLCHIEFKIDDETVKNCLPKSCCVYCVKNNRFKY